MATSMHAPPQEVDPAAALRPPASRRRHWPRRLGVAFLTLVLGTFLSNWWWGRRASARLEAQLATARAAGEPVTVEQLTRWPALRTGTGPNVVPALRAAAELIDSSSDAWVSFEGADKTLPLTDQEAAALAAVVRQYPDVLRQLDRIPADGGVDWEAEYTSPLIKYQYPPTDLNGMRALAQLLQADALLAHGAGDDRRALLRCGQILRLGRAVSYQPQLVPHLVALGITGIGTSAVGDIVPELRVAVAGNEGVPPEQVRALIAELSNERALRDGWRRAMVGERVMVVDVAQSMIEGRLGFDDFRPNGQPPKSAPMLRFLARPFLLHNAAGLAAYDTAVLRGSRDAADAPSARAAIPRELLDEIKTSKRYLLAAILAPSLERHIGAHFRGIAELRLAAAALATRLYEADHAGRALQALNDLVPAYLPSVPLDPLATGGVPLRNVGPRQDPQRPRIYSVGENGVDNGGNEPAPDASWRVREATSDVVRHLKRQPRVFPETVPSAATAPAG
jgi:hypothetical protein